MPKRRDGRPGSKGDPGKKPKVDSGQYVADEDPSFVTGEFFKDEGEPEESGPTPVAERQYSNVQLSESLEARRSAPEGERGTEPRIEMPTSPHDAVGEKTRAETPFDGG